MFGASLTSSSSESISSLWHQRWLGISDLQRGRYIVPGGSVGHEFVDQLSTEFNLLSEGETQSERVIVFCAVVLQKNKSVRKTHDIRRLLGEKNASSAGSDSM